jgi:hypothetical protein
MRGFLWIFAAVGTLALGLASPARAQDMGQNYALPGTATTKLGQAELSVGGGFATLSLPDIRFGSLAGPGGRVKNYNNSHNFGDEFGGTFGGNLVVPWSGNTAVSLGGFWTSIDQNHNATCSASSSQSCEASGLVGDNAAAPLGVNLKERTKRDVDNWGSQLEGRYYLQGMPGNNLVNNTYVAAGGDIRQINQDTSIDFTGPGGADGGSYKESLDSSYYGGYLAIGGDYNLPFFTNLKSGLGLQSGFKGYVGIYGVNTDYSGRVPDEHLGLSSNDAAVIAGLSLETRKQFTPRTSLSLVSTYEYYSFVPDMKYADSNTGSSTRIDDTDAFSTRTMLRLNIGLGPDGLYYK